MGHRWLGAAVLGGIGYPLLEMVWRGRTHPAMALAGAVCLPFLRVCARIPLPRPVRALVGAAGIVGVEAAVGMGCNRDYRIWDYRRLPCNFRGQICANYACLWYGLALVFTGKPKKTKILRKLAKRG